MSSRLEMLENLRWVMESPSLLLDSAQVPVVSDQECRQWLAEALPKLLELESHSSSLDEFLRIHRKSGRLGNLFEALLQFWLEHLVGVQRLASSVAIREGGETRGELDFVFRGAGGSDKSDDSSVEHWEAAVKFFMCIAPAPELACRAENFVGQALVDRLDRKLDLSLRKQLPLARHPRAREVLAQLGFSGEVCSRLFFKGRLFYPLEWNWRSVQGPPEVSPQHERGWWLAWSGADSLKRLIEADRSANGSVCDRAWMVLDKESWMGRVSVGEESPRLLNDADLLAHVDHHFTNTDSAVQLARLTRKSDGSWLEQPFTEGLGRGMLLCPGWPDVIL